MGFFILFVYICDNLDLEFNIYIIVMLGVMIGDFIISYDEEFVINLG